MVAVFIFTAGFLMGQIPDWENPKMFDQNKEVTNATLVPFKNENAELVVSCENLFLNFDKSTERILSYMELIGVAGDDSWGT